MKSYKKININIKNINDYKVINNLIELHAQIIIERINNLSLLKDYKKKILDKIIEKLQIKITSR